MMKMAMKYFIANIRILSSRIQKEYVILSEEGAQSDDDDMIELIPMINQPDESGDGGKLIPIETDEEWDMIEEVVNTEIDE